MQQRGKNKRDEAKRKFEHVNCMQNCVQQQIVFRILRFNVARLVFKVIEMSQHHKSLNSL